MKEIGQQYNNTRNNNNNTSTGRPTYNTMAPCSSIYPRTTSSTAPNRGHMWKAIRLLPLALTVKAQRRAMPVCAKSCGSISFFARLGFSAPMAEIL